MITLYDNVCSPCLRKSLWRKLRAKAAEERVILARKDVSKDIKAREEANNLYGMPTPFVVLEDGKAVSAEAYING